MSWAYDANGYPTWVPWIVGEPSANQVVQFVGGKWVPATITTPAPVNASYVTLSTDATLTNERVLTAGSGITVTDGGAGSTVTVGLASTPAPVGAQYVTLATDATLTSERVLTAGTGISITDGGAGGAVTVASTVTPGTLVTSGSATLAFGASMAQEASVDVTGQTGILVGSKVWAWLVPTATTQHSADEVMVNPPSVFAGNIVAGTGFTIYGNAYNLPGSQAYGDYTVAWAWV